MFKDEDDYESGSDKAPGLSKPGRTSSQSDRRSSSLYKTSSGLHRTGSNACSTSSSLQKTGSSVQRTSSSLQRVGSAPAARVGSKPPRMGSLEFNSRNSTEATLSIHKLIQKRRENIQVVKEYINKEIFQRQFCVLHWEGIITKILPLGRFCIIRGCCYSSKKLEYEFCVS